MKQNLLDETPSRVLPRCELFPEKRMEETLLDYTVHS